MVFITLGSQKFQFNRLLKVVDNLKIDEEIFAQIGYSDYEPIHYKYTKFLDRNKFSFFMDEADIVITHGGTGAIISALKKGKKVIAVPRLKKFGEHVDDHQIQLVEEFSKMNLICACLDMDLEKSLELVKSTTYREYKSNTHTIIKSLEEFIEE